MTWMFRPARLALAAGLLFALLAPAAAATISSIALLAEGDRTRLVIASDEEPRFGTLRLSDPDRLVIDLAGASFDMAPSAFPPTGRIRSLRFGLIAKGKARIVLDLAAPVKVGETVRLAGEGGAPLYAIDLLPTSAAEFRDRPANTGSLRPTAVAAAAEAPAAPSGPPIVMIDPGHGGVDTGAIGRSGEAEKEVTLAFAKTLVAEVNRQGRIRALLTREEDVFVALPERVAIARRAGAALLVSIHADTVRQRSVRGATVYTVSEQASDGISADLAEQENRSDVLAGLSLDDQPSEVVDILIDLARRETRAASVKVAKAIVGRVRKKVKLNKVPWRQADFRVLRSPDIPSVLVELGYMSNAQDEKLLLSDKWRASTASAIATALDELVSSLPAVAGPPEGPANASVSP